MFKTNIYQTLSLLLFPRLSEHSSSLFSYIDSSKTQLLQEKTKHSTSESLEIVYIGFPYEGEISDLIDRIKLGGEFDIAYELSDVFAQRVWKESEIFIPTPDIITYVPPDKVRKTKRGFHFARILAKRLAKLIYEDGNNIKFLQLLNKIKTTSAQSSLSREERLKNLKHSFVFDKKS